MRNRKIRILHEGREYYLVDRGRTTAARTITFLKPAAEQDEETDDGPVRVKTDIGDCLAIANWSSGKVNVEKGHESMKTVFQQIVDRYLEEFRTGKPRKNTRVYYFLSTDKRPLYTLSPAQPEGLTVRVFSALAAAERAAETLGEEGETRAEATGDLADFLSARATEGFAGAVLDDRDPIFFCLDGEGAPRFLRVSLDDESGQLHQYLLAADGEWTRYDGDEEVTPDSDPDVLDRYMIDRIGDVPFLGFRADSTFFGLAKKADPSGLAAVSVPEEAATDGEPFYALFHDRELAATYMQDHLLDEYALVPVDDLMGLARKAREEDHTVILQPGSHRVRNGALWLHEDSLILDTFSGLWVSRDGVSFRRE